MKPATNLFTGLVLLLLLLVAGCSERDSSAPTQADVNQAAQSQPASAQQAVTSSTAQENIRILPAEPNSSDDLRVVISGVKGKLSYLWEVNGVHVTDATRASLPAGNFKKDDQVAVTVSVNGQQFRAETMIRNTPPEIVSLSVSPRGFYRGIDITVATEGHDADGDEISYSYRWLINDEEQLFESGATLPGDQFRKGDRVAVIVTPHDDEAAGQPFQTGELVVENAPPYFISTPPETIESARYRYEVRAVDPDDDPLRYRLETAPNGMSIDELSGIITWEMTSAHAGENTIRIVVSDPDGAEAVQEFTMNLTYAE